MIGDPLSFVVFAVLPAAALLAGAVYSLSEIRKLGDPRFAVVVVILGFMLLHQSHELVVFVWVGQFPGSVVGEMWETIVNLLTAGSVYYLLAFVREQQELKAEIQTSTEQRREARARLEEIFDNVSDGILLIDTDRDAIIEANRSAREMLRYDPGDLVGRSPYDIHPDEPERYELFAEEIHTDGGAMTDQLRCRRGDGSTMPAAVSGTQTTLDDTEMLLVTIRDDSERERYRTQLALLARVLRHNLRNDMTVILGTLTVASEQIDDETISTQIETAINKANGLTATSDKTRKLTEILAAAQTVGTAVTDLVDSIAPVVDDYASQYPDAEISTEWPESARVEVDESVRWAIENLLENAMEHTREEPTVVVRITEETITEHDTTSEWITLTVADDGPGIPESEIEVLEDNANRSATRHGSGLGLWIVQQIARAFDGHLEISQNPDSEFTTAVRLRLQPAGDVTNPLSEETNVDG